MEKKVFSSAEEFKEWFCKENHLDPRGIAFQKNYSAQALEDDLDYYNELDHILENWKGAIEYNVETCEYKWR